ncbi:hypothetical protein [Paenibacillus beijingensis]|uniref:Uncharacterized protein n=1 Tax=Paenibacillus beijingensis TaxID=1126833 RepID=A0A0D5NGJ8_9BACL|nr:hypothetical protein [Paenibacillus beijingensis]AJY74386.1 hypothetical protein VN24_07100 [Paenibacillus beijingensis]
MSENEQRQAAGTEDVSSSAAAGEPRKVSLAEAVKRKLEQKKQQQAVGRNSVGHHDTGTKAMKSQMTKKPNNQRKRMGV